VHERPVVVFSGGGTGGHLYPALAIADALRARIPEVRAVFVGASRGVEARILPELGEEHLLLPVSGIDRTRPLQSWRAGAHLAQSLLQVGTLFRELRPEAVVVTGGYASAPSGFMAGMMGIPLLVQEQNAVPGLAVRVLAHWAERVHVAFPEAVGRLPARARAIATVTGNPVRPVSTRARAEARADFGLPAGAFVTLVMGGSQGSLALNRLVLEGVRGVVDGTLTRPESLQLLWQTGLKHFDDCRAQLAELGDPAWVHPLGYIDDMPTALAATDVAVSRSGAMSTAELLNQGLPSVLVPLPTAAADHQSHNAASLQEGGAAVWAPERGLTGAGLWETLLKIAGDEHVLDEMRGAARSLARPHAADEIATDLAELIRPGGSR